MTKYAMTLETLKNMDESQLQEMFIDMDDLAATGRIGDAATKHYVKILNERFEQYKKTESQDAKELDDATRYREHESDNRRPY